MSYRVLAIGLAAALVSAHSAAAQPKGRWPDLPTSAGPNAVEYTVAKKCTEGVGAARFVEQVVGREKAGVLICDVGSGLYVAWIGIYHSRAGHWRLKATTSAHTEAHLVTVSVDEDGDARLSVRSGEGRELLSLPASSLVDESVKPQ